MVSLRPPPARCLEVGLLVEVHVAVFSPNDWRKDILLAFPKVYVLLGIVG